MLKVFLGKYRVVTQIQLLGVGQTGGAKHLHIRIAKPLDEPRAEEITGVPGAHLKMSKLHGQVMKQLCMSHTQSATSASCKKLGCPVYSNRNKNKQNNINVPEMPGFLQIKRNSLEMRMEEKNKQNPTTTN